jgi:hypothetical protein
MEQQLNLHVVAEHDKPDDATTQSPPLATIMNKINHNTFPKTRFKCPNVDLSFSGSQEVFLIKIMYAFNFMLYK